MIRLYFVGDGPRDAATVPHFVSTILATEIDAVASHWARLNGAGKGYQKKTLFAIRQAQDVRAQGLVAVVDKDKAADGSRLQNLRDGRDEDRAKRPPFPAAFGDANPHGESWLLDDPAALRQALELGNEVPIPSVRRTNDPKKVIDELIQQSRFGEENPNDMLAAIARRLDPSRCLNQKQTGFDELAKEVRHEIGPILPATEP